MSDLGPTPPTHPRRFVAAVVWSPALTVAVSFRLDFVGPLAEVQILWLQMRLGWWRRPPDMTIPILHALVERRLRRRIFHLETELQRFRPPPQ